MTTLRSMDVEVECQPLQQWPNEYERTPPEERDSSRFETKGILDRTLDDLGRELRLLDARDVVLQIDVNPNAVRRDGLPYANANIGAEDSGVVLTFENDSGVQTYPCDTYRTWEENLRAIALTLHDLRRISRYGVGQGSEQYRGFTALPEDVDQRLGPEEAARLLVNTAGYRSAPDREDRVQAVLDDETEARRYYREAAKRSHPDRTGDDAHFKRVQTASHVLEQHFGARAKVGAA